MNLIAERSLPHGLRHAAARRALLAGAVLLVGGCHPPDPRSVEGALDAAARAVEARDPERLFRVIDQRARHALASIVKDRRKAAAMVREAYPPADVASALRDVGDAANVASAAALFARRCEATCMDDLARQIGAPVRREERGDELVVYTSREATLRMHLGTDGWWGIVWHTDALERERDQAAQALRQIRTNADTYGRRRALESK